MYILHIHKEETMMKATVLDLRYKMNEVLKAIDRREKVIILYHGRVKGTILPSSNKKNMKVEEHPFFGMNVMEESSVEQQMESLRKSRSDAV
jgi:antitoxin (DNA-binding transcriptional repressor) of toxin-antitoxin stability system